MRALGCSRSALLLLSCGAAAPPRPRLEPDSDLRILEAAARWPNPSVTTLITLANLYSATGRASDGFAFFSELRDSRPDDAVVMALAAQMRAEMSGEVELLSREAWVRVAIEELDAAVALDASLPRFLRAVVLARLPSRFGEMQRAIDELRWLLEDEDSFLQTDEVASVTRFNLRRIAWQLMAQAHETAGEPAAAQTAWARAGGRALEGPALGTSYSVDGAAGFRFSPQYFYAAAPGIEIARGFDYGDIAFIRTEVGLVVVDAGTTNENAAAALAAYRAEFGDAPVHTLLLTHAHWDHIGGVDALREPRTRVYAQAGFADELAVVNAATREFGWFFGERLASRDRNAPLFDVQPDVLVDAPMTLGVGGLEIVLRPTRGGETEDALLVHLPESGVVFVGDAFMPYFGAPQVAEGSPEGLIATIDELLELEPSLLIHGHPPLTDIYQPRILAPLRDAFLHFRAAVLDGILNGVPVEDVIQQTDLPDSLRDHPEAVLPAFVQRQTFIQRLYRQRAGYWQPDFRGVEPISREGWAGALDLLAGGNADRWAETVEELNRRGDFAVAWRLAEHGLFARPGSERLAAARQGALHGLRRRYQATNPFKLIVFSQLAQTPVPVLPAE